MTIVTKFTLTSGDPGALEGIVEDIRDRARRKGAQFRGPHSDPPAAYRVPQHRRLTGEGGRFEDWDYTVYGRRLELVGHEALAQSIIDEGFPDSVHVEVELEQTGGPDR